MELVGIAYRIGDVSDGQAGQLQKLGGFDHAVVEQEFLGSLSQCFLEDLSKVAAVQAAGGGDILHGDIILEILFHISQCFLNIEVTDPPALLCCHIGGRTGEKIQEQISVSDQVQGGAYPYVRRDTSFR